MKRQRHRNRHIHADHAHLHRVHKLARRCAIGGINTRAVAVLMRVDQLQTRGKIRHTHHAQHRAENFFTVNRHLGGDVVKQGPAQEIPRRVGNRVRASIDHQRCALARALFNIACNFGFMRRSNQRPHVLTCVFVVGIDAVANIQTARAFGQTIDQLIRNFTHRHRDRNRHAALACRAIRRARERIDHSVHIRIGHHQHVVFRPAQRLHTFAMRRSGFINILCNRRGANETHRRHIRVGEQAIHRNLITIDHIKHAIGQTRLL